MRISLFYQSLLLGAGALLAACSGSEDFAEEVQPPNQQLWDASVGASLDSIIVNDVDDATRALYVGGNTDRFLTTWDKGDVVHVYKDGTEVGTLEPAEESWGSLNNTILNGTLTGPFAVDDELKLYLPSRDIDYTGQNGDLSNMSLKYSFQNAKTTVTEAANQILTMRDVSMTHSQTYWRMRLTDEDGNRLHMKRLEVSTLSGNLVLTKQADGTTTHGTLEVDFLKTDGEYPSEPFVAVNNDNAGSDTYKFKAWVGDDIYYGPSDRALTYTISRGKLANIARQMKKTTAASTLTVAAIPSQVFTGYDIEPVLTVKDGASELTLATDYSVSYSDNVNVGTATATIKGLADAGATAATKYLGTQDKAFSIVKATPVIEMSTAEMTLVNNATQQVGTRTIARVFIDNNGNGTYDEGTDYDITAAVTPSITYSTASDAIATVAGDGTTTATVTAASFGSTTVTVTVAEAANWTSQTATYTVTVNQEVNGGNSVNPWNDGGSNDDGKIYVE